MKRLLIFLMAMAMLCSVDRVTAYSDSEKPSKKDISKAFSDLFVPTYLEVTSFKLLVSENVGSKVEPLYKARFKATIKIKQDTFKTDKLFKDVAIVKRVKKTGEKIFIYGISTSHVSEEKWVTKFRLEKDYFGGIGQIQESFKKPKIIIKGTSEEKAYYEKLEKIKEEKRSANILKLKNKIIEMIQNKKYVSGQIYLKPFYKGRDSRPSFYAVFTDYDPKTETFKGKTGWWDGRSRSRKGPPTVVLFEGKLSQNSLYLKEIKYLKKGKFKTWREQFGLGVEYFFKFEKITLGKWNGEWIGEWKKDQSKGRVRLWHLFKKKKKHR